MTLDDWKSAYLRLDSASRRELARWIIEIELGGQSGLPPAAPPSRPPLSSWLKPAATALLVACLAGTATWAGVRWHQEREAAQARQTEAERAAAEAKRPRSPFNLEVLRSQLGREVTVTGVPIASEVGMLYFARDKRAALRLNLMPTGVVLMQSRELEALVSARTEVTATGIVSETPDGGLEMKIHSLGQLRYRGGPPAPRP
jgi:hypothetical protein